MKIVAGLGNPGRRYVNTRHNVGFLAIDNLVTRWCASGPKEKHNGEIYSASLSSGEHVILVRPCTFMNLSGKCICPLLEYYRLGVDDLIVIHDDVDLQFMTLRIRRGGGTGGHNGLKSIDNYLGSGDNNYHRIRIGVGRPDDSRVQTADWVLRQFPDDELGKVGSVLENVADSVELVIQGKQHEAMNKFNKKSL